MIEEKQIANLRERLIKERQEEVNRNQILTTKYQIGVLEKVIEVCRSKGKRPLYVEILKSLQEFSKFQEDLYDQDSKYKAVRIIPTKGVYDIFTFKEMAAQLADKLIGLVPTNRIKVSRRSFKQKEYYWYFYFYE